MKKYKLIKEYPGSPPIKFTTNDSHYLGINDYLICGQRIDPSKYPEYWEEIVEKDYEILSVVSTIHNSLYGEGNIHILNNPKKYTHIYNTRENPAWDIYSVKRLSDGEVFTIGDRVSATNNIYTGGQFSNKKTLSSCKSGKWVEEYYNTTINNFKFIDNKLCIMYSGKHNMGQPIEYVKKLKKLLFTTEDGVDIFENDYFYDQTLRKCIATLDSHNQKEFKRFSTKEAAEEYILMNKPCLSIHDIYNICHKTGINNLTKTFKPKLLKKLVKSKL